MTHEGSPGSGAKQTVSAVIPAYNEEKTVGSVVKKALVYVDEVIVIDDGSTDDTSEEAAAAGARVVTLEQNTGVLGATARGLREARGDIIVTLDADGQHDPQEIPRLVEPILEGRADLVMGKRPSFPHFTERAITVLTGLKVRCGDASTGFRAIRRGVAEEMELHGSCLCGTFVLEAHRLGARMSCVPITVRSRDGPRRIQTRHFKQLLYVLYDLLRF